MVISKKKRIRVLHQVLDPSGIGGVSAEFRALSNSKLNKVYDFRPMILTDIHPGISWKDIKFYYRRINKTNPDIIHIRGAAIDGLNAVLAAKLARKGKILVTVHGMYSDLIYISPLKRMISKYIVEKLIFNLADGISCVCSNANSRKCFDKYRKKMLPFVYNRMPHFDLSQKETERMKIRSEYNIDEKSIVALYVGRITKEKGLSILLNSINSLRKQWPQKLVFMFVGEGDYLTELKTRLSTLKNRVVFTGNQKNVDRFYFASDFFIQPSLHENHSISILEACAAGVPSIVTDCGGNTEIIHSDIGEIVHTGNSYELTESIKRMMQSNVRQHYMNNLINHDFSAFYDDEVDNALDKVYKKILEL